MKLVDSSNTPSLRVRPAEMRALSQIKSSVVSKIYPVLKIHPLERDSDSGKTIGNLGEHLERKIALIQRNMVNCAVLQTGVRIF